MVTLRVTLRASKRVADQLVTTLRSLARMIQLESGCEFCQTWSDVCDEGTLHYLGHTSSFKAQERRDLLKMLRPLESGESYADGRSPGGGSRWTGGKEAAWVSLKPTLVCEVSYDYLQGDRFRHASTFVRWRDDKAPADCRFDQLERPSAGRSSFSNR